MSKIQEKIKVQMDVLQKMMEKNDHLDKEKQHLVEHQISRCAIYIGNMSHEDREYRNSKWLIRVRGVIQLEKHFMKDG